MSRKVSNTLIVIIIGFVMFSVTLGLLLNYVNFNPMTCNIKTDNVSCNIKGLEISEQIVNDSTRKENSLLNSDVFRELKIVQQERGAKGETNFVIRNLTKYDFNFVENSWYLLNILNFRYIFNMIEVDNNYGKNNSRTSKYFNRWSIFRILWKSQTTSRINKKTKTFKWNW